MIQRYSEAGGYSDVIQDMNGEYVSYTDHVEAVKQARRDMAEEACDTLTAMLPEGSIMPLFVIRAMNAIRQAAEKE